MVTGKPSIARKIASKSARCMGSSLASARCRPSVSWRDDHLPHRDQPVAVEEHVLGAAEPDPLGAEVAAAMGVGRGVGVDAHAELPDPVGPLHQAEEVAAQLGRAQRRLAGEHLAGAAVHRDPVALGHARAR